MKLAENVERLGTESAFKILAEAKKLENEGKEDLIIVEVQYGNFLREDDIDRYKDIYNRK